MQQNNTPQVSSQFLEFLLDKAKELEDIAGYSGSHHDGGARELRNQVEVYISGQYGEIPEVWEKYHQEFKTTKDPEYDTYLRLKRKFG